MVKYVCSFVSKKIVAVRTEDGKDLYRNSYNISKKRFLNMGDAICNVFNTIAANDASVKLFENMGRIKNKFKKELELDECYFSETIKKYLLTDELKQIAIKYVDDNYKIVTDEKELVEKELTSLTIVNNEEVVKLNKSEAYKDLWLSDIYAVDLERISFVMKFIIPLITEFHVSGRFEENVYLIVFKEIMNMFNDNNIIDKLIKFINSKILYTKATDQKMWDYLKNVNYNMQNAGLDMFTKIVTLILYKFNTEQYPIHLIIVALRKQIDYVFTKDHGIRFSSFVGVIENNDGISNFDKMSTKKYDEGAAVISKVNKSDSLKKILRTFEKEHNITVNNVEYRFYYDKINPSTVHTSLIYLFYSKYMDTANFSLSKEEYIILSIILHKFLLNQKMQKLATIMISNYIEEERNRKLQKKDFITKLNNTKLYKEIIADKYAHISDKIDGNKNPILNLIYSIYYGNWKPVYFTPEISDDNKSLCMENGVDILCYETLIFTYDLV